jgi:hypothetical protein
MSRTYRKERTERDETRDHFGHMTSYQFCPARATRRNRRSISQMERKLDRAFSAQFDQLFTI